MSAGYGQNLLANQTFQGSPQLWKAELISAGSKLPGLNPRTGEQHFLRRFLAESETQRKLRHRKNCRPFQYRREYFRELRIPHCMRGDEVHWAGERLCSNCMMNAAYDVIHVNPAHPLLSRSESSAEPQFEGSQHFSERATFWTENHANPHVHRANARSRGDPAGLLPLAANLGQKAAPHWALFSQNRSE